MEIEFIQKIYSKVHNTNIELPRIVVIGPQSSGKSSVLEQIVQLDFLPKGLNMVTRCPIIMHLKKSLEEFVVFEGEEEKYKEGEEIRKKLELMTKELCGEAGVSKTPIIVNIYLKDTLEITLIDLPGLTKVPVEDQPEDIEIQIKEIVLEYATGDNTIILAVINANVDIANSESLKIAKLVDRTQKRTLGVVTKIDLMDEGTNCVDILQNKRSPLQLGYIGILNRSYQDIQNGITIKDFKKKEQMYYKKTVYSSFTPRIGSTYLLERLFALFYEKVKKTIPKIKIKLYELLKEEKTKLKDFTSTTLLNNNKIIVNYSNTLQSVVGEPKEQSFPFYYNLENVLYDFKMLFNGTLLEFDFEDLESLIRSSDCLLFHEPIVRELVRVHTNKLASELLLRIQRFVDTLSKSIKAIQSKHLPQTVSKLNDFTLSKVIHQHTLLTDSLSEYFKIQSLYVNPKYPAFSISRLLSGPLDKTALVHNSLEQYLSTDNQERETIIKITKGYMEIIRTNLVDHSLKSIYYYFIYYLKNSFLYELIEFNLEIEGEVDGLRGKKEELEGRVMFLEECLKELEGWHEWHKSRKGLHKRPCNPTQPPAPFN